MKVIGLVHEVEFKPGDFDESLDVLIQNTELMPNRFTKIIARINEAELTAASSRKVSLLIQGVKFKPNISYGSFSSYTRSGI